VTAVRIDQAGDHVENRGLASAALPDERRLPTGLQPQIDAVQGRRVDALRRRGKYLAWELEDEAFLLVELGLES